MSTSLHLDGIDLEATTHGCDFVLLRHTAGGDVHLPRLGQAILDAKFTFIDEVIATEVEICLKLNENFQASSLAKLEQLRLPIRPDSPGTSIAVNVPVWFSEAGDWQRITTYTGLARDDYIRKLLSCDWRVAMLGFLPGFIYLDGLPDSLHVPRKENPDRRIDGGTLAIGGGYAGIYSLPSPAGWNAIGQVGIELLHTSKLPPMQLLPNMAVRLVQIDRNEHTALQRHRPTLLQYNGGSDGR